MPRYYLNQPDGKLAMFSTVVDDFTYAHMTDDEALDLGVEEFGRATAKEKIAAARNDEERYPADGLHRWRSALVSIAFAHGLDTLKERLKELGFEDFPIPEEAVKVAEEIAADRAKHAS